MCLLWGFVAAGPLLRIGMSPEPPRLARTMALRPFETTPTCHVRFTVSDKGGEQVLDPDEAALVLKPKRDPYGPRARITDREGLERTGRQLCKAYDEVRAWARCPAKRGWKRIAANSEDLCQP